MQKIVLLAESMVFKTNSPRSTIFRRRVWGCMLLIMSPVDKRSLGSSQSKSGFYDFLFLLPFGTGKRKLYDRPNTTCSICFID
jgi:hypothetical protein